MYAAYIHIYTNNAHIIYFPFGLIFSRRLMIYPHAIKYRKLKENPTSKHIENDKLLFCSSFAKLNVDIHNTYIVTTSDWLIMNNSRKIIIIHTPNALQMYRHTIFRKFIIESKTNNFAKSMHTGEKAAQNIITEREIGKSFPLMKILWQNKYLY